MTRVTLSTLAVAAVLAAAVTGSAPAEARRKVLVIGDLNAYGKGKHAEAQKYMADQQASARKRAGARKRLPRR